MFSRSVYPGIWAVSRSHSKDSTRDLPGRTDTQHEAPIRIACAYWMRCLAKLKTSFPLTKIA